jgi:FdhD protein
MARGRTETVMVQTVDGGGRSRRHPAEVIVEEPMTIQLDGNVVATTMRTPGHDYELAVGFCFGAGLLGGSTVTTVRYCATGAASDSDWNLVTVDTAGRAVPLGGAVDSAATGAATGGRSGGDALDLLAARMATLAPPPAFDPEVLRGVPAAVLGEQRLLATAGAVHVAAAFDATGTISIVREDVGRGNAVDKVVGRLVLDHLMPANSAGLFASGSADFALVAQAWAAGFGTLVTLGGATSLAVAAARRAGLTLAGSARAEGIDIY